jgi:hypothetical protein
MIRLSREGLKARWPPRSVKTNRNGGGDNDRTIREILSDFERVRETPAPVVRALEQAGIDPAAKSKAKVVNIAAESVRTGCDIQQAIQTAMAASRQRPARAQIQTSEEPTKEEKLIYQVRLQIRKALQRVPQNKKLEYLQIALGEEINALLGDQAREFVVTPTKPTLDLLGRKRSA